MKKLTDISVDDFTTTIIKLRKKFQHSENNSNENSNKKSQGNKLENTKPNKQQNHIKKDDFEDINGKIYIDINKSSSEDDTKNKES
jgi:hypothetical protein